MQNKSNHDKAIEAHEWSCHWLAEANEAAEKGNMKREEMCLRKSAYWLDRLNKLEGYD